MLPVFIDPIPDGTILGMPVIGATIPAPTIPNGCVGNGCGILKAAIGTGFVFNGTIGATDATGAIGTTGGIPPTENVNFINKIIIYKVNFLH